MAAMDAAEPKEIPMSKPNSKRKTVPRPNSSKIKNRTSSVRSTVAKSIKLKPATKPTVTHRPRSASQQARRSETKQARIIAMLRAPGGATIDAMAHATGWQQHSVRGFLAGVVRKKLGLTLVSADGDNGRIYRVTERTASAAV